MSWHTFHHQAQLVHTAIGHIERTCSDQLPWQDLPEAGEVFTTPDELLSALHTFWHDTLAGRVDQALENDSHHSPVSVAKAWWDLAGEYPGLRRLLDHSATHPCLATALRQEYRLLAVAAGMSTMAAPHEQAATAGLTLIERWHTRATHVQNQAQQSEVIPLPRRSWWRRNAGRRGRRSAVAVA